MARSVSFKTSPLLGTVFHLISCGSCPALDRVDQPHPLSYVPTRREIHKPFNNFNTHPSLLVSCCSSSRTPLAEFSVGVQYRINRSVQISLNNSFMRGAYPFRTVGISKEFQAVHDF